VKAEEAAEAAEEKRKGVHNRKAKLTQRCGEVLAKVMINHWILGYSGTLWYTRNIVGYLW